MQAIGEHRRAAGARGHAGIVGERSALRRRGELGDQAARSPGCRISDQDAPQIGFAQRSRRQFENRRSLLLHHERVGNRRLRRGRHDDKSAFVRADDIKKKETSRRHGGLLRRDEPDRRGAAGTAPQPARSLNLPARVGVIRRRGREVGLEPGHPPRALVSLQVAAAAHHGHPFLQLRQAPSGHLLALDERPALRLRDAGQKIDAPQSQLIEKRPAARVFRGGERLVDPPVVQQIEHELVRPCRVFRQETGPRRFTTPGARPHRVNQARHRLQLRDGGAARSRAPSSASQEIGPYRVRLGQRLRVSDPRGEGGYRGVDLDEPPLLRGARALTTRALATRTLGARQLDAGQRHLGVRVAVDPPADGERLAQRDLGVGGAAAQQEQPPEIVQRLRRLEVAVADRAPQQVDRFAIQPLRFVEAPLILVQDRRLVEVPGQLGVVGAERRPRQLQRPRVAPLRLVQKPLQALHLGEVQPRDRPIGLRVGGGRRLALRERLAQQLLRFGVAPFILIEARQAVPQPRPLAAQRVETGRCCNDRLAHQLEPQQEARLGGGEIVARARQLSQYVQAGADPLGIGGGGGPERLERRVQQRLRLGVPPFLIEDGPEPVARLGDPYVGSRQDPLEDRQRLALFRFGVVEAPLEVMHRGEGVEAPGHLNMIGAERLPAQVERFLEQRFADRFPFGAGA